METNLNPEVIKGASLDLIRNYMFGGASVARRCQNTFVNMCGHNISGKVVEIGGDRRYQHKRFFPKAQAFVLTNVSGEYDQYLDVTNMSEVEDNSIDTYLCVSVLEHVKDFQAALSEIERTLKVGGKLILGLPFCFRVHDSVDYWRFGVSFFEHFFTGYEVLLFVQYGNNLSTIAEILRKPRGKRYITHNLLGFFVAVLATIYDPPAGMNLGYGIFLEKKPDSEIQENG